MTKMKDLFSSDSRLYRKARPSYPAEVVLEILKYVPSTQFAWDCAAGSGQFTQLLVPYFEQIVATDLSTQQLHQAAYFENVSYQVQPAEKTTFTEQSFDLITVAQAIHWFDFESFYQEVGRTLKKDGVLAIIGYGTPTLKDQNLQSELSHLYWHTLKDDWDEERRYIDDEYQSIPFPFESLVNRSFSMPLTWSKMQLLAYLNTWSAIKHYRERNQTLLAVDPLDAISDKLNQYDQQIQLEIEFPVFLKIGKAKNISKSTKSLRTKVQSHSSFYREMLKFC